MKKMAIMIIMTVEAIIMKKSNILLPRAFLAMMSLHMR